MRKQKIIIVIGSPGAGKGYFSEQLLQTNEFVHYSPGRIMRQILKNPQSPLYKQISHYIWQGHLVPPKVVKQLMKQKIAEQNKRQVILDGYPRNEQQQKDLVDICKQLDASIKAIYYLKIDPNVAKKRLTNRLICSNCEATYNSLIKPPLQKNKCDLCHHELQQRKDDQQIDERFLVFHDETQPIILKYANHNEFHVVNSENLNIHMMAIKQNLLK